MVTVEWHTAPPLWDVALADSDRRRFKQPALLRFAEDNFMESLLTTLATAPTVLPDYIVQQETWGQVAAGWQQNSDPNALVKLYQPAHQRFYLISASLVCRIPGFPDKVVVSSEAERTSFVLRKLQPVDENIGVLMTDTTSFTEYAWVPQTGWCVVDDHACDLNNEECLPLFPLNYGSNGQRRRILAGFVPVASRETFQAAATLDPTNISEAELTDDPTFSERRFVPFQARVLAAMQELVDTIPITPAVLKVVQARQIMLFILLDLAELLGEFLPNVWQAVEDFGWSGSGTAETILFNLLDSQAFQGSTTWADALRDVYGKQQVLIDGATTGFVTDSLSISNIEAVINNFGVNTLEAAIDAALAAYTPPESEDATSGSFATLPVPKLDPSAGAVYAIRCVYERPFCKQATQIISELSVPFQLASFFDPQAPIRPIRITMPLNTSLDGFRKAPKGVSILLSNELRQQVERIQNIAFSDLDDIKIPNSDSLDFGMICSLSIPIITICALILLMIIVQLLNIIFWWLPFFKICLPLNLKAD